MKKLTLLVLTLFSTIVLAQNNTEIYLFDIKKIDKRYQLTHKKNISSNEGYDSQPHFYDKNTVLFSSTRNGQTDIVKYDIITGKKVFINNTPQGGEYSPQRIPKSNDVSAVRLDNSGLQRFYQYNIQTGESKEVIKDLKVAYPFWHDHKTVVSAVIGEKNLELVVSNIKKQKNHILDKNVGRSFHRIPNTNNVSYINKENTTWEIRSLNVSKLTSEKVTDIDGKYEDICWLPDGSILQAKKNEIIRFDPTTKSWSSFYSFENTELRNISRIIVNPEGTQIAIVAESSVLFPVEKQLEYYNKRDIDNFLKYFSKDVKVYDYPNTLQYTGRDEMRKRYASFFANTKDLNCTIVKRIVKGSMVIDEESIISNGRKFNAVAIYEVENGKIIAVTFL